MEQYKRLNGKLPAEVFADRGYKVIKEYKSSVMHLPKLDKAIIKEQRIRQSRRAAIEPVIGNLKNNYRLCRNYLKGILGDNEGNTGCSGYELQATNEPLVYKGILPLVTYLYIDCKCLFELFAKN